MLSAVCFLLCSALRCAAVVECMLYDVAKLTYNLLPGLLAVAVGTNKVIRGTVPYLVPCRAVPCRAARRRALFELLRVLARASLSFSLSLSVNASCNTNALGGVARTDRSRLRADAR